MNFTDNNSGKHGMKIQRENVLFIENHETQMKSHNFSFYVTDISYILVLTLVLN
jgi:hypothetical protein